MEQLFDIFRVDAPKAVELVATADAPGAHDFEELMGVDFYAEKLFMTSRSLNLICQKVTNQSVSEIIETRKIIEAKNLLAGTGKSISEIGFELGYNEKSHPCVSKTLFPNGRDFQHERFMALFQGS